MPRCFPTGCVLPQNLYVVVLFLNLRVPPNEEHPLSYLVVVGAVGTGTQTRVRVSVHVQLIFVKTCQLCSYNSPKLRRKRRQNMNLKNKMLFYHSWCSPVLLATPGRCSGVLLALRNSRFQFSSPTACVPSACLPPFSASDSQHATWRNEPNAFQPCQL